MRALLATCGLEGRALTADDVGFQVGPRINASGRLGSAQRAVDLLLSEDPAQARRLAAELDGLNEERKAIETRVLEEARAQASDYADAEANPVLVLAGEGWHQGVVGIVAARLAEDFGRPAVVIGLDGDLGRGSARTVDGFHLLEALSGGAEHMLRFGGHAQAAGCEVHPGAVEDLRPRGVRARPPHAGGLRRAPRTRAVGRRRAGLRSRRPRPDDLGRPPGPPSARATPNRSSARAALRPASAPRAVGRDQNHLLIELRRGDHRLRAMGFRLGARLEEVPLGQEIDAVFSPRWNTFRGQTNLELTLHDFRTG